jgi:hypothetical protein
VKRGVFDILRRGLDNAIANWPVLLLRIGEMFAFMIIAIGTVLLALVPILVSLGIKISDLKSPEDMAPMFESLLTKWTLLVYIVAAFMVMILVFVLVHSFVEAGCARIYVDGDRVAGPAMTGPRSRYRVFSMAKFWAGAVDGWWPVFWMYNVAWGIGGLIMLVPLLPTLAITLLARDSVPVALIAGCLGLVVATLVMMVVAVAVGIWTNRAVASWAVRRGGARDTLRAAWAAFRADMGRHLLVAGALFLVSFAGSMFIGSFSFAIGIAQGLGGDHSGPLTLMLLPARFFAQFINSAFSAAVAGWFLSSFCALANEQKA